MGASRSGKKSYTTFKQTGSAPTRTKHAPARVGTAAGKSGPASATHGSAPHKKCPTGC